MESRSKRMVQVISWLAVIVWMAVIFYLSSQVSTESNRLSTKVTQNVAYTVEQVNPSMEINMVRLNRMVRKNAHFIAYLVLGVLVIQAMRRCGVSWLKSIAYSLLLCTGYAISDEWHQYFVPGRGPQVQDVWIDSFGATVGICTYGLVSTMRKTFIR